MFKLHRLIPVMYGIKYNCAMYNQNGIPYTIYGI